MFNGSSPKTPATIPLKLTAGYSWTKHLDLILTNNLMSILGPHWYNKRCESTMTLF
jgi:hypothetical protein